MSNPRGDGLVWLNRKKRAGRVPGAPRPRGRGPHQAGVEVHLSPAHLPPGRAPARDRRYGRLLR